MINFLKNFCLALIIAALICSSVGFLYSTSWFFDLFNHFRPQAIVASLVLIFVSLLVKDWNVFVISLFVILGAVDIHFSHSKIEARWINPKNAESVLS
jgi:hypothetical protein